MSASDTDPLALIRLAEDKSLTEIARQGIGGYLLALSLAFISTVQAVIDFLLLPFTLGIDVGTAAVEQLIIRPLNLTDFGLFVSAQELPTFGIFALPISSGLALFTIGIFIGFLALSFTGADPTSLVLDNPIVDFFFETPEEEFEGED